jgi:acetophenone carboxylase
MASGDPKLKLEFRDILDKRTVGGQWIFRYCARPTQQFKKGDIFTFAFSVGGAGYGDPLDRDPELVMADIKGELISEWSAENIYRVSYDKKRFRVDKEKTNELRQKERKKRLKRGKPYAAFEKEWVKKKPPEETLKFYGSWPDAQIVNPIQRI